MKKLLTLFTGLLVISACNTQNPQEKGMTAGNHEELIKRYYEHFNKHEWTKMAQMYSDTSEFKDPSLGKDIVKQTRQQIADKYAELHKVFPDIHDRMIHTYPSGENTIVVEFISTGTASDSSSFELPICTIFTIEKGLITKDYTYYDNF